MIWVSGNFLNLSTKRYVFFCVMSWIRMSLRFKFIISQLVAFGRICFSVIVGICFLSHCDVVRTQWVWKVNCCSNAKFWSIIFARHVFCFELSYAFLYLFYFTCFNVASCITYYTFPSVTFSFVYSISLYLLSQCHPVHVFRLLYSQISRTKPRKFDLIQ